MANEKRLIDANALRQTMESNLYWGLDSDGAILDTIDEAPTVDAVEVVHGCNVYDHDSAFECSVCGWSDWDTMTADTGKYNYCPNCGAKMDGDGNA